MKTKFYMTILMVVCILFPCVAYSAERHHVETVPQVERDEVICFALYTVHNNIMKMTAQLYPLQDSESPFVYLDVKENGKWKQIAKSEVIQQGWVAQFRVEKWDSRRQFQYRLRHDAGAQYTGIIQKDPVDKKEIVVAAFTGNSIFQSHGGDIPRDDIVANIQKIQPDLLFFSGDQVYDHTHHYAFWLKFGRDFGDIIRNIPTVTIPDDHDVGQGNLWGSGGKKASSISGDDGGYFMPAEYVKEVERCQTSHLPDPFDPTPIQQGIGVYYTSLNVGGISFAILEDRKFKTGWLEVLPDIPADFTTGTQRPHSFRYNNYDPTTLDVPDAKLLGDRQLHFLEEWAKDWTDATFKCVLSQTVFCDSADRYYTPERRRYVDFDANGWPQTGRNKALLEMRKAFAFHINGDTHLGTIFQYGVNEWNDAGYTFTVPSIANLFMRWWDPDVPGKNRQPGMPEYTGEYLDGFGNKITCWAVANPSFKNDPVQQSEEEDKVQLTTRAAGFGVVRFNKSTREITMECWPRKKDITDPETRQYEGWSLTIKQEDNYGRKAVAYLPTLKFKNMTDPVVQVIEEKTGQVVYTLRILGKSFRPKVFCKGAYTVHVGEGKAQKTLKGIEAISVDIEKTITID